MQKQKSITIYSCGGMGVNLGTRFQQFNGAKSTDAAIISTVYIDTSRSNMRSDITDEQVFLVPSLEGDALDGSGKKRDSNYKHIAPIIPEILHKHRAGDLNIVIHSASGGSGSVLGPLLVNGLLEQNRNVIVIMAGSRASAVEFKNTRDTFISYDNIATNRHKPIPIFYRENINGRGVVDGEICSVIPLLATICSGNNRELDSQDITNFLNFGNFPLLEAYAPGLVSLEFFSGNIELPKERRIITAITLTDDNTSSDIVGAVCPYQAVGYVNDNVKKNMDFQFPLHACLIYNAFGDTVKLYRNLVEEYEKDTQVVRATSIAGSNKGDAVGMAF